MNRTQYYITAIILIISHVVVMGQKKYNYLPKQIGWHEATYEHDSEESYLLPWTTWDDALEREMNWYLNAPLNEHGYPSFVNITFMDVKYQSYRDDNIPAIQNGTGILSYIKYWKYKNKSNPKVLEFAKLMGDYLVKEANTPNKGAYPNYTRSTGYCNEFPLTRSSQYDANYGENVIEPDKGGIAGYALLELYKVSKEKKYLNQAVHNAEVLSKNMRQGNAKQSPWPFRVNSITGEHWGEISSNMVYILRLFDGLIEMNYSQFEKPRQALWEWIVNYQLNSSETREESLWGQFFEDQKGENNRNAWAPLNMARYLIEKQEALDPDWKKHAQACIDFSVNYFGMERPGTVICVGEQDEDKRAWGGVNSTFGAVAAMFYAAGGGDKYRDIAFRNLTWMTYFIREDGVVCDQTGEYQWLREGGWQEDCHTDVIHNFMDALNAVPEWATAQTPDGKVQAKVKDYFPKPKNGNTYVIAHRGVHLGIPENSLPAYQKAIDLGCDFVEVDVRKTKDGRIVSVHNSTVDKYVKGVTGKVNDFTLAELKQLDIGERIGPEWRNTRIATMEEILQLCRGQIGIYLDLKEPLVEEMIELLRKYDMERDVFWCVSNMRNLLKVKDLCYKCVPMPDVGNERNLIPALEKIRPRVVAPVMGDFSETYVGTTHKYGAKVFLDEDKGGEKEWEWILNQGTDGIQTDDPEALIRFIQKRNN